MPSVETLLADIKARTTDQSEQLKLFHEAMASYCPFSEPRNVAAKSVIEEVGMTSQAYELCFQFEERYTRIQDLVSRLDELDVEDLHLSERHELIGVVRSDLDAGQLHVYNKNIRVVREINHLELELGKLRSLRSVPAETRAERRRQAKIPYDIIQIRRRRDILMRRLENQFEDAIPDIEEKYDLNDQEMEKILDRKEKIEISKAKLRTSMDAHIALLCESMPLIVEDKIQLVKDFSGVGESPL